MASCLRKERSGVRDAGSMVETVVVAGVVSVAAVVTSCPFLQEDANEMSLIEESSVQSCSKLIGSNLKNEPPPFRVDRLGLTSGE